MFRYKGPIKGNVSLSLSLSISTLLILGISSLNPKNESETGYTFSQPGKSYVEYRHAWVRNRGYAWMISLRFRTVKSSAFLFHHFHLESLASGLRPQVWVRIKKGGLQVSYTDGGPMQTMVVGKGLGRDQWHRASVGLDLHRMELSVNLDLGDPDNQRSLPLRGRNVTSASGQRLTSVISVGGYSPDIVPQRGHFVGCVKDVQLFDGQDPVDQLLASTGDVEAGCHSQCETRDTCQNGGKCVNHYVSVTCDCYGTLSDGKYCENSRVAITLQGSEWLIYDLYDDEFDGSRVQWNRLALEFKTTSSEGILFYARELYPLYSHLAVSLRNSSLHISIIFVDQVSYSELFVSMGTHLDDDRWHQLTIVHQGQSVDARLDTASERMTADRPNPRLRMPPSVYFGGMDVSASVQGLHSQRNFVGCLRSLYFNRESILDRLNTSRVRYHDDGSSPYQGCHAFGSSSLQFTHDGAFARVEHPPSSTLQIQLQFRTLRRNCFILYTESSAATPKGFLQLSLVDGQLSAAVMSSGVMTTVAVGNSLGDNAWHALSFSYDNGLVHLKVDEVLKVVDVRQSVLFGDSTYLGFGPNTEMDAYIGCMRSLKIQDLDLDPVKAIHSQLGVGVTLGDCDLIDWCHGNESTLCLNGGTCVNSWTAPICDCATSGHYEGSKCQIYLDHSTVTFMDPPSHILFHVSTLPSAMLNNLSLSLRTIHRTPMLVLMLENAASNTSLEIEMAEEDALVMSYGRGFGRTRAVVAIPGLASGYWQNVTILQEHGTIHRISVNGDVVDDVTYTQKTIEETDVNDKWTSAINASDWVVNVGGRSNETTASGHVTGFVGCLSDLRIGDFTFELAKMSHGLRGVGNGCTDRCLVDGCNNGGICVANGYDPSLPFSSSSSDVDCDCSMTGWSGRRCDEDLEIAFDGTSLIVDSLRIVEQVKGQVRGGNDLDRQVHDLEIHLTISTLTAHFELPSAFAAAQGNSFDDFLVVYLTPGGSVSLMWNFKGNKVVLDDVNFGSDGRPHRISVIQHQQLLSLQVDGSIHQVNLTSSKTPSFPPKTFQLGGVLRNTVHFKVFRNFTGVISNAFLRSSSLASSNSRPLDVFYGFHGSTDGIRVLGPRGGVHSTHSNYVWPDQGPSGATQGTRNRTTETGWRPYKDLMRHGGPSRRRVDDGRAGRREEEEEGEKEEMGENSRSETTEGGGDGGRRGGGFVGFAVLVTLLLAVSSLSILLAARRLRLHRRQQDPAPGPGQEPSDEEEGLLNEPLGYVDFTSVSDDPPTFSTASPRTRRGTIERGRRLNPSKGFGTVSVTGIVKEEDLRSTIMAPPVRDLSLTPEVLVRRPGPGATEGPWATEGPGCSSSNSNGAIELRMSLTGQRCQARFHGLSEAADDSRNEEEEEDDEEEGEEEEEEEEFMEWDPQNDVAGSSSSNTVLGLVGMATTRSSSERTSSKIVSFAKTQ